MRFYRGVSFLTTFLHTEITMNTAALTKVGIALGILYAAYRFVPNASVKAAVLGVGGVIVAKQLPYVKDVV